MNKAYWKKYYRKQGAWWKKHLSGNKLTKPTAFAVFCNSIIKPQSKIIELGSGNGRDAYFFGARGHEVTGVDYTTKPPRKENVKFVKQDAGDFLKQHEKKYDIIYSRFFFHAISKQKLKEILDLSSGIILAEARSIRDKSFKKDHKRNLIDGDQLITDLLKKNFHIMFFQEGKGLAVYKQEDPIIIRIMAEKWKK